MHDILSTNSVGPFIMLVLRGKTNKRLQADAGVRLCLLALLYFKGKYIYNIWVSVKNDM